MNYELWSTFNFRHFFYVNKTLKSLIKAYASTLNGLPNALLLTLKIKTNYGRL